MYTSEYIKVLSTKALNEATVLDAQLLGYKIDILPQIEIAYSTPEEITTFIEKLWELNTEKSLFVFTSKHAVIALSNALAAQKAKLPIGLKLACVGDKTANEVKQKLQHEVQFVADHAEALANAIIAKEPIDTFIVYGSGNLRQDILPDMLTEAGFDLLEQVIYATNLTPQKASDTYDVVLFFSPSGVESFLQANDWKQEMLGVAIGATTAAYMRSSGIEKILVSKKPNTSAMMEVIKKYLNKK